MLSAPLTSLLLVGRAGLESGGDFLTSNKLQICSPALTLVGIGGSVGEPLSDALQRRRGVRSGWHRTRGVGWFRDLWAAFRPSLKAFRSSALLLLSYGVRSYGIDLCGTMALYVDQNTGRAILQPKMMGTYVVALSLSRVLNAFHTSVIMVLFPKAVSQSSEAIREMTSRAMRMSSLLTGPLEF